MRITQDDFISVVNNCPKQRFAIKYEPLMNNNSASAAKQLIFIRASQGHSLNTVEIDLE